jgi:L-threonylcarbamoyladenylate synthase
MARILPIDSAHPQPEVLREAAEVLRSGQLVAFPTETVYGLGGLALSVASLEAIFRAKGRPATHPLIAHVLDQSAARQLAASWPMQASLLAKRFWPGPLTMVLERDPSVPEALSGGKPTVAIRVPANPVSRGLLLALGEPIAAPSANHYQALSPTRAEHVQRSLGDRIALILDGGPTPLGLESTVVDLTTPRPRLLRPGALPSTELRASLPDLLIDPGPLGRESDRHSPGQDPVHYAPKARLVVLPRAEAIARAHESRERVGLILRGSRRTGGRKEAMVEPAGAVRILPSSPEGFGREIFAALHDLDAAGVELIAVEALPDDEAWLAVRDRLERASRR